MFYVFIPNSFSKYNVIASFVGRDILIEHYFVDGKCIDGY